MPRRKAVRWTLKHASAEFDIEFHTLRKRLLKCEIQPDDKETYSTKQICTAVFGDIAGERLRHERLRADLLEIELKEEQGRLVNASLAYDILADVIVSLTQKVKASGLSDLEKSDILKDIRSIDAKKIVSKREADSRSHSEGP